MKNTNFEAGEMVVSPAISGVSCRQPEGQRRRYRMKTGTHSETRADFQGVICETMISRAFVGRSQVFRPIVADVGRREPILRHPSSPLTERWLPFGPHHSRK